MFPCVWMCLCVFQCKLEQQACLTGKDLTLKCSGLCPCPTSAPTLKESKHGKINNYCMSKEICNLIAAIAVSSFTRALLHNNCNGKNWWRELSYHLSFWPPQKPVLGRICLISASVWGIGSSYCRAMPSRTTTASQGPEPPQPAAHQVAASTKCIPTAIKVHVTT